MSKGHQLKVMLITEDGESFLCAREFYVNDLYTGEDLGRDKKIYQGRRFKIVKQEGQNDGTNNKS